MPLCDERALCTGGHPQGRVNRNATVAEQSDSHLTDQPVARLQSRRMRGAHHVKLVEAAEGGH